MPTSYPGGLDDFPNDAALEGNTLDDILGNATKDHTSWMDDVGAAIEAVEAKVGIDGSAVTTSIDYKINNLAGDVTGPVGATVVGDDSHAHTSSTISALDAADVTTGTFAQARLATGIA